MSAADQQILQEAKQYVSNLLNSKLKSAFVYHNLSHTREVVKACEAAADYYKLNEHDRLVLLLAAWFHDTGYTRGVAKDHEEYSQKFGTDFLKQKKVDQSIIDAVNGCILATKMPQAPTNLIEQILCDADLNHLGLAEFEEKNKLLRQEVSELQDKKINKKEWKEINLEFLRRHRFFTEYFQERLDPAKQKYIKQLTADESKKERQAAEEKFNDPKAELSPVFPTEVNSENKEEKEQADKEKKKKKDNERGIVTLFRIMSSNHVNLSQMADSKANIMISVNTIVISILVSVLLGKLQFYPEYIVPTVILVVACLSAIIFAILATRPNVSGGTFTKEDISHKTINLLFFGNFFKMELPDYQEAMKEMMADKEFLFSSMVKDIYFLGVVLGRKYKLLRISYNIFMFGLVVSVITFCVAFILAENKMSG